MSERDFPAFPRPAGHSGTPGRQNNEQDGMTLRDWFAGNLHLETEILESVSKCDDADLLERFGTEAEKEEGFTICFPGARNAEHNVAGRPEFGGDVPFRNIELRQQLEARARARLRLIEADAMLAAREAK